MAGTSGMEDSTIPSNTTTANEGAGFAGLLSDPKMQEGFANLGAPQNLQDVMDVAEYVYGQDLPSEFQMLKDRLTQAQSDPSKLEGLGTGITNFGLAANEAYTDAQAQGAQIPSQLNVLQTALKMKSGVGNQPIGESETFKKLGVTGIGALSASLGSRLTEMDAKYGSFANMVKTVADAQVGTANAATEAAKGALNEYSILMDQYRYEQDRIDEIEAREKALEDELTLYTKKAEIDYEFDLKFENATKSSGTGDYLYDLLAGGSSMFLDGTAGNFDTSSLPDTGVNVSSAIGGGIITGYGSELWGEGLDFVLEGGKGAEVVLPFGFEVIEVKTGHSAGEKGSFGNQVKIRTDDGKEIWFSHLDTVEAGPGSYMAGTVIGTQGNTGSTYSLSGGDGTHLDITMPKEGGGYYSAKEVAAYLGMGQKSEVSMEGLTSLATAIAQSEVSLGSSAEERMAARNMITQMYLEGTSIQELTDRFLTDTSPEALEANYKQDLGFSIRAYNEAVAEGADPLMALGTMIEELEKDYGQKNVITSLKESGNIDANTVYLYDMQSQFNDFVKNNGVTSGWESLQIKISNGFKNFISNITNKPVTEIEAIMTPKKIDSFVSLFSAGYPDVNDYKIRSDLQKILGF